MKPMKEGFTCKIEYRPPRMAFLLFGPKGVVQFVFFTHVPSTKIPSWEKPMAMDLGYHSKVPMYEGQTSMEQQCEYLGGSDCFYDGSSLNAEPILESFINGGDDAVWYRLEEYYQYVFEKESIK